MSRRPSNVLRTNVKKGQKVAIVYLTLDSHWNSQADITGLAGFPDGKVDMMDISLIARHFQEHYS